MGVPLGQAADWRVHVAGLLPELGQGPNGPELHVHQYLDHYSVHLDRVSPINSLVRHNALDFPPAWAAMATSAGVMALGPLGLGMALVGAGLGLGGAVLSSFALRASFWRRLQRLFTRPRARLPRLVWPEGDTQQTCVRGCGLHNRE